MKKIVLLSYIIFLFASCGISTGIAKKKFLSNYEYSLENRDYSKRAGYKGKKFTIEICDSPVSGYLVLEKYDGIRFNQIGRSLQIEKGKSYEFTIDPNYLFLTIVTDKGKYRDNGNPFHPAKGIKLDDYLTDLISDKYEKTY